MITFEEYKKSNGELITTESFDQLEPHVCDLIHAMIRDMIPYWRIKPNLQDYGLDLTKIITLQIDFIENNGGMNVFNGHSDFNCNGVSTSGFNYSMDNSSIHYFDGIPVSPIVTSLLKSELAISGLTNMVAV